MKYKKPLAIIFLSLLVIMTLMLYVNGHLNLSSHESNIKLYDLKMHNKNNFFDIRIDRNAKTDDVFLLKVENCKIIVKINEERILDIQEYHFSNQKTTGENFYLIPIKEEYRGGILRINLTKQYKNRCSALIYRGEIDQIFNYIFREDLGDLIFSVFGICWAVSVLIYWLSYNVEASKKMYLINLVAITIATSIWRFSSIDYLKLFSVNTVLDNFIYYFSLACIAPFFAYYVMTKLNAKNSAILRVTIGIAIMNFIFCVFLQFTRVKDFGESVVLIYFSIFLIAAAILYAIFREFRTNMILKKMIPVICTLVIMTLICVILSAIFYIDTLAPAITLAAVLVFITAHEMREIHSYADKIGEDKICEDLVFIDEMTGVYNRTAYENKIQSYKLDFVALTYKQLEVHSIVVFLIDLNSLKTCNDLYGHEFGDKYIQTVVAIIKEVFSEYDCYRIGGDEFCIFAENITQATTKGLVNKTKQQLRSIPRNENGFKFNAAIGYAYYDRRLDADILGLINRADAKMYRDKQSLKKEEQYEREKELV